MKRIFIVGTSRSGTTLLQSAFANHPEVYSPPETHFFSRTIPLNKIRRKLNLITEKDMIYISSFFGDLGAASVYLKYSGSLWDTTSWCKYLVKSLDQLAIYHDKSIFVEKTPMHIRYIPLIEKIYPDTIFIHNIRNPISNIASLYDASIKHPEYFKQNTIDKAIKRYLTDIKISESYNNKGNHFICYYEDVVNEHKTTITNLLRKTGLNSLDYITTDGYITNTIVNDNEDWKNRNNEKITKKDRTKSILKSTDISRISQYFKRLNLKVLSKYDL